MYLSSSQISCLGLIIRMLSDATDGDSLREAIGLPLLNLLSADQYASMVWSSSENKFKRFAAVNMSADGLRNWDNYYKFIDPLTFPLMKCRHPTLVNQIMPQSQLLKTEFFADFLRPEGMYWGVNVYFFNDDDESVGDFRIFRKKSRDNFNQKEIDILRLLEPGVCSALARLSWNERFAPKEAVTEIAEDSLQKLLKISKREAEVAWLVSSGCPDKIVSKRLKIGIPTVRFHMKNLFEKLNINNRVAMATRVQNTLESHRRVC